MVTSSAGGVRLVLGDHCIEAKPRTRRGSVTKIVPGADFVTVSGR
jgi:hypothetical protein